MTTLCSPGKNVRPRTTGNPITVKYEGATALRYTGGSPGKLSTINRLPSGGTTAAVTPATLGRAEKRAESRSDGRLVVHLPDLARSLASIVQLLSIVYLWRRRERFATLARSPLLLSRGRRGRLSVANFWCGCLFEVSLESGDPLGERVERHLVLRARASQERDLECDSRVWGVAHRHDRCTDQLHRPHEPRRSEASQQFELIGPDIE